MGIMMESTSSALTDATIAMVSQTVKLEVFNNSLKTSYIQTVKLYNEIHL